MPKTDLGRRFVADYLKIPEVAQLLGLSEKTVRRRVKAGEIPSVFIGGVYRISRADLEEYLERAKVRPGKVEAPSSQEKLFNNGVLEEQRRASSVFSETLVRTAEQLASTEPPQSLAGVSKIFGILDVLHSITEPLLDLTDDAAPWENRFSAGERLEIVRAATNLYQVSKQLLELSNEYLESRRESAETRRASQEAEARREQMRELTRRISA
jgi:excisionase family DNA binding protein